MYFCISSRIKFFFSKPLKNFIKSCVTKGDNNYLPYEFISSNIIMKHAPEQTSNRHNILNIFRSKLAINISII